MTWLSHWHLPLTVGAALMLAAACVQLTDPLRRFIHPNTNDLDAGLWEFDRREGRFGSETVLVVGSSVAREGIDPDLLSERLKRPAFNLALSNAQIVDVEEELALCGPVGTVVLAVNGFNFDDRMKRDPTHPWNRPAGPYLMVRRAELQALVSHRVRSLVRFIRSRARDDYAEGRKRLQFRYKTRLDNTQLSKLKKEMSKEYPDDGRDHTSVNFEALARVIKRLRKNHTELFVVWLPELPEARWAPFERSRERLASMLEGSGVRYLDLLTMRVAPADFYDYHHVLAPGRARLTDYLSQALDGQVR